jgi:hypothetical protein
MWSIGLGEGRNVLGVRELCANNAIIQILYVATYVL